MDTAEAYLQSGDQYADAKAYDQAIADYTEAIRLRPDCAEAYNNRGYAHCWNTSVEYPVAIADYREAIRLRPSYAYNNRGADYMASGQPALAVDDVNQALALQPDYPQAYTNRANAELRLGDWAWRWPISPTAGRSRRPLSPDWWACPWRSWSWPPSCCIG